VFALILKDLLYLYGHVPVRDDGIRVQILLIIVVYTVLDVFGLIYREYKFFLTQALHITDFCVKSCLGFSLSKVMDDTKISKTMCLK